MKHFKGPLTASKGMNYPAVIHDSNYREIAYLVDWRKEFAVESLELARVFSAAPGMLEELEFLINHCVRTETRLRDKDTYEEETIYAYGETIERIRKLIFKAKGQVST